MTLLERYQSDSGWMSEEDYRVYLEKLQASSRLDNEVLAFAEKGLIHDSSLQRIRLDFENSFMEIELSDYECEYVYYLSYKGVDFSKTVLVLENQIQFLVDEISLEERYVKHDLLVTSWSSQNPNPVMMTIICQEMALHREKQVR
ncbi:hypothetical protein BU202_09535 [Streptococcus cuniculi]|uniref:Uncharacterized protein n=1 Tax=Streptococcus cuniculi TaxID=1432788 RepID=A0A1Q8E5I1_9STRE|nr:hypothetical protein [Streptococcus cuniculi]OLF47054.1 hypothetical protein BU202_09535 [Streptococcus cuniculi]